MEKLKQAFAFAMKAHEGQIRKVSGEEYVKHPIAVGNLLKDAGFSEDVVIAGYLHDTVEDTNVTFEDIQREFGNKVIELVKGNTENKSLSWIERKTHTVEAIRNASLEIKALIVADKLDNLKSLSLNYDKLGDAIWDKFKGGPDKQRWYYQSIVEGAFVGLNDKEIPDYFYEYKQLVKSFFED